MCEMPLVVFFEYEGAGTTAGCGTCQKIVNQRETPKLKTRSSESRQAGRNECQKITICTVLLASRYAKIETDVVMETIRP